MQTNTVAAANSNNVELLTTTDRAAAIRADLKKILGAGSRDVSVRCEKYSMGATIHVTVKTSCLKLAEVEAIADAYQTVDRCALTGDILNGGNTYVRTEYTDEALAPLMAQIGRELDAIKCFERGGVHEFRGVGISWDGYHFTAFADGINIKSWDSCFARQLAIALLNGKAQGWGPSTVWTDEPEVVNSQVAFLEAVGAL